MGNTDRYHFKPDGQTNILGTFSSKGLFLERKKFDVDMSVIYCIPLLVTITHTQYWEAPPGHSRWTHTIYNTIHSPPTLAAPHYFQNKFLNFTFLTCQFLRQSFMPRIRFVGFILAKIEGVKV